MNYLLILSFLINIILLLFILGKNINMSMSMNNKRSRKKDKKDNLNIESAIAVLQPNESGISGIIKFVESGNNKLKIEYNIKNLKDGKHGFHIHKSGNMTKGCDSACSHFNPFGKNHGSSRSKERHAGDLGNIISKNNISKGSITVSDLSLNTKLTSIIGRTIIVHEDEDDLGRGIGDKKEESLKTGNAGKRLACAVIGIM